MFRLCADGQVQARAKLADKSPVERRREHRIGINQIVTVTVLSEPDLPPFQAVAIDLSEGGIGILSPTLVPYQAAVKVEGHDVLLLGEVIRVQPSGECHVLALKLQHSLSALGDLRRLNRALRWESLESVSAPVKLAE